VLHTSGEDLREVVGPPGEVEEEEEVEGEDGDEEGEEGGEEVVLRVERIRTER
jgi:hypothetical protein